MNGASEGDPALMTIHEVAQLFRKTPRTIWNWTHKKKLLEALRIGGSVYYLHADVERLISNLRHR